MGELALVIYEVRSRNQTQVVILGGKYLYPLHSHWPYFVFMETRVSVVQAGLELEILLL